VSVGLVRRDDTTATFFEGTADGRFLIRRCTPAGHTSRPQARQCATCGSTDLRWDPVSGGAQLVSWAVVPARPAGGETSALPTIVAVAELDEGPWWWSQVVGADPEALVEGQRLRIVFEQPEGGEAVPVFELA
jgi:uncharacterized protein